MPPVTEQTEAARAPVKAAAKGNGAKAKRPALAPKRLQKRILTLAEAADEFERADDALLRLEKRVKTLKAQREEAEEILQAHFEKTGHTDYRKRIGWCWTTTRLILDQDKVSKYLGEQLAKFQRRTESKRKLTRLSAPRAE